MITDGIININKPQNMTSHDVVGCVRRTLGIKKVGHTGTLDPMATGVLPICVGRSTRIIEYLDLDLKKYRCILKLGVITDTQDVWGEIIDEKPTDTITEEAIRNAFESFHGIIDQLPPMYSAIKINGKRLYKYAREGEKVEVPTRKIFVDDLEIEDISLSEKLVTFVIKCSKGTYIRTICQDVGDKLGCGGTLAGLVRLASGNFVIEKAIELEKFQAMSHVEIEKILYQTEYPLIHFGSAVVDKNIGERFANGWHIEMSECEITKKPEFATKDFHIPLRNEYKDAYNIFIKDNEQENFVGIAFYDYNYKKLVADKVFFRGEKNADI